MDNSTLYRGYAWVVGINDYDFVKKLDNAVCDAMSMAEKLKSLNFFVKEDVEISRDQFIKSETQFVNELKKYDVGLFYFAGHGIEHDNHNYLVLKDSPLNDEGDVRYLTFPFQDIIDHMHQSDCKVKILILDACRDYPFDDGRGMGSLKLAPVAAPQGTIIAYSTSPGQKAKDSGTCNNSVYTGALLQHVDVVGLQIEEFFKRVRTTVYNLTGGSQISWEHTSLIGPFSFNAGMMIQSIEIGYPDECLKLSLWPSDSKINGLKDDFLSGNFSRQESALNNFKETEANSFSREELFLLGRLIVRAASWNSFACIRYIESYGCRNYYDGEENCFCDGMLYEVFFDDSGNFNSGNFELDCLNKLIPYCKTEGVRCSFDFIYRVLQPFSDRLVFIPSSSPVAVNVDVVVEDRKLKWPFRDEKVVPLVVSIKHDSKELLDETGNDFWTHEGVAIKKSKLHTLICEAFGIPFEYLKVVLNVSDDTEFYIKGGFVKL